MVRDSRPPRSRAGSSWSGAVGGAQHEHAPLAAHAVDLGQQLVDLAVVAAPLAPLAGDGVDLVEEDDRRLVLPGPVEEAGDGPLGLAQPRAGHVGVVSMSTATASIAVSGMAPPMVLLRFPSMSRSVASAEGLVTGNKV